MVFKQHKNHPVVSPSLPNPTWRSNGIIPEQASTSHHPPCLVPAGTRGRSEPQGWEGSTSYCHTQPGPTGLSVDNCPCTHGLSRNWDCAAKAKASGSLVLREVQELGTHRSRDFWEAAEVKDSPGWLQTLHYQMQWFRRIKSLKSIPLILPPGKQDILS